MEMQEKKEKVLVFCSRAICYMSGNFFAYQIGAAFEELGFDTEICELSDEDDLDEKLMAYLGERYRLILDFNSKLPRMVLEDGTPYLDALDGPFFDYILDHPLFHYNGLTGDAKNLHVLVLDEGHKRYVESYYTKAASVHVLPLGATKALYEGEKEAECRILFTGTYDSPDMIYERIKTAPQPLCHAMKNLVEQRLADPLLPMENALCEYFNKYPEHGAQLFQLFASTACDAKHGDASFEEDERKKQSFALAMNAMYLVDVYVRDYFREAAVDTLLAAGIPVTVLGEGWNKYRNENEKTLCREKGVPFAFSFERIAKAHILLNSAPIFNQGMHDRIPAGMANHTVVLTDGNPYLRRRFTDGEDICFYEANEPHSLREQAESLMENAMLREQIAARAYQNYETHHTWECRARAILAFAERKLK